MSQKSRWQGANVLAALIIAAQVGAFAAWCLARDLSAAHDDANLLLWAVDLEAWLRAGARGGLPANVRGAPYPPLVPLVAAATFWLTDLRSVGVACASAAPWLGTLSAAAAWSVGAARGPAAGLAACALAPMALWSLGHPGSFHVEVPLACSVGAVALVGWRLAKRPSVGIAIVVGALAAVALLTKWTAALFLFPLWVAGVAGPARRWMVAAAALALALCGPWYLPELPRILSFTADNLAGDYTGEAAGLALAAPFYPSRLVTGVLGAPALVLAALGVSSRRSGPHRAAALALLVGVALLTLQPYRDQRYLIAGLGLLAPILVEGGLRISRRWAPPVLIAVGLLHTATVLDPVATPWPDPGGWTAALVDDRDGLRRRGLQLARRDLMRPRLRLRGPAPDAVGPSTPPLRQAARAVHRAAPPGPLTVHVVDTVGRSVLERLKVELALLRGPGVQVSRSPLREAVVTQRLQAGRVEAWMAPPSLTERAWIIESLDAGSLRDAHPAWAALRAQGRAVVARGGARTGERPAVIQVWGPPGWRGPAGAHPAVSPGP